MHGTLAAAILLVLAGCIVPLEPPQPNTRCDENRIPFGIPFEDAGAAAFQQTSSSSLLSATDPEQLWDALLVANATSAFMIENLTAPPGWHVEAQRLGGEESNTMRFRYTPTADAKGGKAGVEWSVSSSETCVRQLGGVLSLTMADPTVGAKAEAGRAALVYTAGFWENGTLFYTNMESVNDSSWPRAGWYEWGDAEPLPVYVYDENRAEKPAYWSACTPAALPVTPICVWNYYTTIEGFNEALKGLSTNIARVVHIPPEKAYTLPGNEDHDLYGDAIIFYIRIVDVHASPCGPVGPLDSCNLPLH